MQKILRSSHSWYANKPAALKFFLWVVVLPTLFAAIYYGLIASDIYISEAKYAVRTSDQTSYTNSLLDTVLAGGAESAGEDAAIVRDYILSHDMLEKLDRSLDLRKHYTSRNVDFFSRLDDDASQEQFLEYYRQMVQVSIDSSTLIITLRIKSFDPVLSQKMAKVIIGLSEDLVNKLSERIVEDTLNFAQSEVDKAENRVRKASDAITTFRSETLSMDPREETKGALQIVAELETKLVETRAQLIETKSFMQDDSPQVKVLQSKVQALEQQVWNERQRLASKNSSHNYTQLIDLYQPLALEEQLAKHRYASALTSLEAARSEAQRKQRYLLTFVQPQIPDEALLPERFNSTIIIFLELCLIYGIGSLVWAAIKDHMRL